MNSVVPVTTKPTVHLRALNIFTGAVLGATATTFLFFTDCRIEKTKRSELEPTTNSHFKIETKSILPDAVPRLSIYYNKTEHDSLEKTENDSVEVKKRRIRWHWGFGSKKNFEEMDN